MNNIKNYVIAALTSLSGEYANTFSHVRDHDEYFKIIAHIIDNAKINIMREYNLDPNVELRFPNNKYLPAIYNSFNAIYEFYANFTEDEIDTVDYSLGYDIYTTAISNMYIMSFIGDLLSLMSIDDICDILKEVPGLKLTNPYDFYVKSFEPYNQYDGSTYDKIGYQKPYKVVVDYIIDKESITGFDVLHNIINYTKIYAKYSKINNLEVIIPDVDFEEIAMISIDPYSFSKFMCDLDRCFRHYAGIGDLNERQSK